jgi:hypothetical protein
MRRSVPLLVAALSLGGCKLISGPEACTRESRPAIVLEIRDLVTGQRVGDGASITVTDGTFEAHPVFPADFVGPFPLVHEREGIYTVEVSRADYQPWTRSGVIVPRDRCHVRTAQLTAFLAH